MEGSVLCPCLCITLWCVFLQFQVMSISGVGAVSNTYVGPGPVKLPLSPKELRRLKAKGLEVMPSGSDGLSSNSVTDEPSCEELRAMWRYYKRESRAAELTNEVPSVQLPDLFWNYQGLAEPSSFGPFRGRGRPRFRPKGPNREALYGRVLLREQGKGRRRRPMEEVVRILRPPAPKSPDLEPDQPVVHLTPPLQPTPESSLQKLREMYREERMKGAGSPPALTLANDKDFGKVVLSPPSGHDGRIANKPKELMTSFEKIRFGYADDLLGGEGPRHGGLFPVKRRNGFIGLPILNPHRSQRPGSEVKEERAALESLAWAPDDSLVPVLTEVSYDGPPADLLLEKQPFMVEETMPSCPEVENQACLANSDCSCLGFGLYRCFLGQCQVLPLVSTVAEEETDGAGRGLWLSEPLPQSHLGIWDESSPLMTEDSKRKRSVEEPKGFKN